MDPFLLASLISGLFALVGNGVSNAVNSANMKTTNQANKQIADAANAAQAAESQKAYDRSKATNQVALLRQAGMSHAGALGVLNGGGSYTPAPVNVAQMQSPQFENPFQGLSDIAMSYGSNTAQMKQSKEQFDKDLEFRKDVEEQRKREEAKRLQMEEQRMYDDFATSAAGRELTAAQVKVAAKQLEISEQQVKNLVTNEQLTLAQIQTESAKYSLTLAQVADVKEHTKLTTQEILNAKEMFDNIHEDTELKKIQWDKLFWDKDVSKQTANKLFEEYVILCEQYARLVSPEGQQMWQDEVAMSKLNRESAEFNKELLRYKVIDEKAYQQFLDTSSPVTGIPYRTVSNNLRLYSTLLGPSVSALPVLLK